MNVAKTFNLTVGTFLVTVKILLDGQVMVKFSGCNLPLTSSWLRNDIKRAVKAAI